GSSGTVAGGQVVNPANTSTVVSSGANPSVVGQSVTFTATVTANSPGGGTPAGTVTFTDTTNSATLGSTVSLVSGQAQCSFAFATAGTRTVQAAYSGSSNYNSSSATVAGGQIVNKTNTTTAVLSGSNPSVVGQQVTYTATVTANPPGSG